MKPHQWGPVERYTPGVLLIFKDFPQVVEDSHLQNLGTCLPKITKFLSGDLPLFYVHDWQKTTIMCPKDCLIIGIRPMVCLYGTLFIQNPSLKTKMKFKSQVYYRWHGSLQFLPCTGNPGSVQCGFVGAILFLTDEKQTDLKVSPKNRSKTQIPINSTLKNVNGWSLPQLKTLHSLFANPTQASGLPEPGACWNSVLHSGHLTHSASHEKRGRRWVSIKGIVYFGRFSPNRVHPIGHSKLYIPLPRPRGRIAREPKKPQEPIIGSGVVSIDNDGLPRYMAALWVWWGGNMFGTNLCICWRPFATSHLELSRLSRRFQRLAKRE